MALERIFATFKEGGQQDAYDPADPASYEYFIQALIRDSRDYEGSVLAPGRDTAQKYYYGYLPSLNPDGSPYSDTLIIEDPTATYEQILGYDQDTAHKSSFVSTDVRDAVMLSLPSLIRLFAASENVVALTPRTQADAAIAEQQTNYINYVFWQDNSGFLVLYGAFKDALTVRTGFVKWWTDDHKETKRKTFINLNQQQIQMLLTQDRTAKVVHQGKLDPMMATYDEVIFEYQVDKPLIKVMGVPPEEMRLDRYARSFGTSRIVGHERVVAIDELVAMGYPREKCMDYLQSQDIQNFTMESQLRNPGRYNSTRVGDGVLYGEWYIKVDGDGDGVAELRYICTMGEVHEIVHDEAANRVKFAVFGCDPISHTIVGDSLADYTMDVQRIKTNMMRGVLDSLAESINPKTVVNELVTNIDDALNDDLGAVIRTRGDPRDAVAFSTTPFAGQQAMPIIELLNDILQRRTGFSRRGEGLRPQGAAELDHDRGRGDHQRPAGADRARRPGAGRNRLQGPVRRPLQRDRRGPQPAPDAAPQRLVDRRRHRHLRRLHGGRGQLDPRQGLRQRADDDAAADQAGPADDHAAVRGRRTRSAASRSTSTPSPTCSTWPTSKTSGATSRPRTRRRCSRSPASRRSPTR